MQAIAPTPPISIWQRLRKRELNCESALTQLVNSKGELSLELLDEEVSDRFFQSFPDRRQLPPVIPLLLWRNCYYLGCPVPVSPEVVRQMGDRTGTEIRVVAIAAHSYRVWLSSSPFNPSSNGAVTESPPDLSAKTDSLNQIAELSLAKATDQMERIQTIIAGALQSRASDVHLEPLQEGLRIRYRIDGILRDIAMLPPDYSRRVIVALKVMCDMDIAESRRPQDGRIGEHYVVSRGAKSHVDMRVSTLPCVGGEKAVIRLLPQENPFNNLETLGFSEKSLSVYKTWLQQPQGMIIFTGPTGSGKTSTLYTSLQSIAKEHVNVVTVEDPVEYILPRITQTQVHEVAGMTFAAGLRAILRQDPDIIMVGEIRDAETAETAIRAALTGHLVLTTLHTNDAVSAIPRLQDLSADPSLISDALLGIIAQRLVRKVCPHCAEPHTPTESDLRVLKLEPSDVKGTHWRRGRGCEHCFNSGYLGREALIELLNVDESVRSNIYRRTQDELRQYLNEIQFDSFRRAAIQKVNDGTTTLSEIVRVLPHSTFSIAYPS